MAFLAIFVTIREKQNF